MNPGYSDKSLDSRREKVNPEYVYINLPPNFASLVFTIPNKEVNLPENAELNPDPDKISVRIKNNDVWQNDSGDSSQLSMHNFQAKTEITSVVWNGKEYPLQEVMEKRDELLNQFFLSITKTQDATEQLRDHLPYAKGNFLYRAISQSELSKLKKEGTKFVAHNDPSANFETEEMYNKEESQVKKYSGEGNENYSGHVIRWKIEDPLFYRPAGMSVPRVIPMFSHYLKDIEISEDGVNFKNLNEFLLK